MISISELILWERRGLVLHPRSFTTLRCGRDGGEQLGVMMRSDFRGSRYQLTPGT